MKKLLSKGEKEMPRVEIYLDNLIERIDYAKRMILLKDALENKE